jgi:inorganic triphosphatase YgiF
MLRCGIHHWEVVLSQEVELKLVIEPEVANQVVELEILKACQPPKTKRVISTYYDTENELLRKQKIALRLRRKGDQWLQTLKGKGEGVGGLHQRVEIEEPLEAGELNRDMLVNSPFANVFTDELLASLEPVFTTDFQRTAWIVELPQETEVEMVLDRGEVSHRDYQEPICEMELELVKGSLHQMLAFADTLTSEVPTYLENRSKAERGYSLGKHLSFPAPEVKQVQYEPGLDARQLGHRAALQLLGCLQANEKAAVHHQSPQALANGVRALEMIRCAFEIDNARAGSAEHRKLILKLSQATAFFRAPLRQIRFHKEILKPSDGDRMPGDIEHALWEAERRAFDEFNGFVHSGAYARLVLSVLRHALS